MVSSLTICAPPVRNVTVTLLPFPAASTIIVMGTCEPPPYDTPWEVSGRKTIADDALGGIFGIELDPSPTRRAPGRHSPSPQERCWRSDEARPEIRRTEVSDGVNARSQVILCPTSRERISKNERHRLPGPSCRCDCSLGGRRVVASIRLACGTAQRRRRCLCRRPGLRCWSENPSMPRSPSSDPERVSDLREAHSANPLS
jgi:hypothetical protein